MGHVTLAYLILSCNQVILWIHILCLYGPWHASSPIIDHKIRSCWGLVNYICMGHVTLAIQALVLRSGYVGALSIVPVWATSHQKTSRFLR